MIPLLLALATLLSPANDLLDIELRQTGSRLPPEWQLRPVPGADLPEFSIRRDGPLPALSVAGRDAAAWAYRPLVEPLAAANGRLLWSWRTLEAPAEADLRQTSRDDAPLRVYVVFGKPRLFGGAKAIFYSWGGDGPSSDERIDLGSDRLAVVQMADAGDVDGRWRDETARPFDDYRRFWDDEPEPIWVVGVMQDTDATGGFAAAELRSLVWQPGG